MYAHDQWHVRRRMFFLFDVRPHIYRMKSLQYDVILLPCIPAERETVVADCRAWESYGGGSWSGVGIKSGVHRAALAGSAIAGRRRVSADFTLQHLYGIFSDSHRATVWTHILSAVGDSMFLRLLWIWYIFTETISYQRLFYSPEVQKKIKIINFGVQVKISELRWVVFVGLFFFLVSSNSSSRLTVIIMYVTDVYYMQLYYLKLSPQT